MNIEKAKHIICRAIWNYMEGKQLVGCYRCETLVRANEIRYTGRFCYDCEVEIDLEEMRQLCPCRDSDCSGCGTLWCGCINTCRGRCGFKDNVGYSGY